MTAPSQTRTPPEVPFRVEVVAEAEAVACELLAERSGLSRGRVKDAMIKGAVWLQPGQGRGRRLRRAQTRLRPGDRLRLNYDPRVLAIEPPRARRLFDADGYSVWYKPAGLLAQGNSYGDHCALLRQVDCHFGLRRRVYPVHRLDREVAGIMLVAHTRPAAAALSGLFSAGRIDKLYRAAVRGDLTRGNPAGIIEAPLDGRMARTLYWVVAYRPESDRSLIELRIPTGRRHQIRRHLDGIGHPVIGDPRYGEGNKDPGGLCLVAARLAFHCPLSGKMRRFEAPESDWPSLLGRWSAAPAGRSG